MAFLARFPFLVLCASLGACIAPVPIGGNPADTEADPGDTDPDDSGSPAVACPNSPPDFACTTPYACGEFCGGLLSEFDDDGCLRARCETDEDCPADRQCVRLGDWGGAAASSTFCEMFDGTCECGGTADGSVEVRLCVPTELVPEYDPEVCSMVGEGPSFTWVAGTIGAGLSDCTVMAVGDTVDFQCTGAIEGAASLAIELPTASPLAPMQQVTVETLESENGEWWNRWLRITAMDGPIDIRAVEASELLPPGEAPSWWGDGFFQLGAADSGCPYTACEGQFGIEGQRPVAIRATGGGASQDFLPGDAGPIPGKYGDVAPSLLVQQASEGSCSVPFALQWYSLSISWDPI